MTTQENPRFPTTELLVFIAAFSITFLMSASGTQHNPGMSMMDIFVCAKWLILGVTFLVGNGVSIVIQAVSSEADWGDAFIYGSLWSVLGTGTAVLFMALFFA
jgi:hypothetical protein